MAPPPRALSHAGTCSPADKQVLPAPTRGTGCRRSAGSAHSASQSASHVRDVKTGPPTPSAVQGLKLGEANSLSWVERTSAEMRGYWPNGGGLRLRPPAHVASSRTAQLARAGDPQGPTARPREHWALLPALPVLWGDRHWRCTSLRSYAGVRCFQKESKWGRSSQIRRVNRSTALGTANRAGLHASHLPTLP